MKRLIIMRHAEAEQGFDLPDWQRQLTSVGQQQVIKQGQRWLTEGLRVDGILSSNAVRAFETARLLVKTTKMAVELRTRDQLYHASAAQLWQSLKECDWQSVLLVGHLPAVLDLATELLAEDSLPTLFPPATLVVLEFPDSTTEETTEETAEETAEETTEETTEENTKETAEETAEKTAKKPAKNPAKKARLELCIEVGPKSQLHLL